MKKRFICFLFALCFCLSACGQTGNTGKTVPTEESPSTAVSEMDFSFTDGDLSNEITETPTALQEGKTITKAGTYQISGSFAGPVVIEVGKNDKVQLVLENAAITSSDGPAIYIKSGDKVFLTLRGENTVTDGSAYAAAYKNDSVDGAIFSRADLTINGSGALTVDANYKHGIVSKDDLVFCGGSVTVDAPNVALNGKDCVKSTACTLRLTAGTDGIRSDNAEEATRGYVYLRDGTIEISAGSDGIQAQTAIKCEAPAVSIQTTTGKGLKAASTILISGGSYEISTADDCIHANCSIYYSGGVATLTSGDDGMHADTEMSISGGEITVTKSYEGLEASKILIAGGKMDITASDDGLNAAGGNDGSSLGGRPGQGWFSSSTGEITVSGGYLVINASGDGIDSNGDFTLTGGTVLVSGPTNSGNGAFDYDGTARVTGGCLIALGSSGMAQGFSEAENQGAVRCSFSTLAGGTSFAVCDENGAVVIAFTPPKAYQSAAFTAAALQMGKTYTVVIGGTVESADENGFATSGTISGGETLGSFTMDSLIVGGSGGMGGMGGGLGGGPGGGGGRPPR